MYRLMFDISRTFWLGGRSATSRRAAPGQLQYLLIWNTVDNEVRVVDWFNLKYMKKSAPSDVRLNLGRNRSCLLS